MKPTEHIANTASTPKAGVLAPLCGYLPRRGTGAPKIGPGTGASFRRLVFSALVTALGALAFAAAPALAAAPSILSESTSPTAKPSEEARLEATINAGEEAAGETTECHFQYGETVVTEHTVACEQGTPPGALEGGEQGVAVTVNALKAGTTYIYRVVLKNASGEIEGNPEKVTTLPVPATEVPSPVGSTTATFKGTLTPLNKTVATEYFFSYNVGEEIVCTGEHTTTPESAGIGSGTKTVTTAVTGLEPHQKYTVCLLSTNTLGDSEEGLTPKYVETLPAPPTVEAETASGVSDDGATPAEARLEATVNANNEEVTSCEFQYGTEASLATNTPIPCEQATPFPGTFESQPADVNLTGLTPKTKYYYRVLATNATGVSKGTAIESFTTPLHPETPTGLEASPIAANTATLNATLNPGKEGDPGTYQFHYRQSATECEGGEPEEEKITPATNSLGGEKEAAKAPIAELLPHKTYTFCLLARNEAGEESTLAGPITFITQVASPTVEEAYATEVAATSVTLHATVNPQGAETSYVFEYAPVGGAFTPVAEPEGAGTLPEGTVGVPVEVHVQHGLEANVSYEFRVVASNSAQKGVPGKPASFTTEHTGSALALPDGRQWEMVTPPDKHGALFFGYQNGYYSQKQASVHGNAFVVESTGPSEAEPQGFDNNIDVLSTRGPDGWSSQSLGVPRIEDAGPAVAARKEYHFFSDDLSRGVVSQFGNFTPLSPEATEATSYIHTGYLNGNVADHCESSYLSASSCYRPLVTRANDRHTPFEPFGQTLDNHCFKLECGPWFDDGTPDLSHVILESNVQLSSTPAPQASANGSQYEWSEGQLQALPDTLAGQYTQDFGLEKRAVHTISTNGQRLILENGEGASKQLLLRVNAPMPQSPLTPGGECTDPADACSIQINATQGGSDSSGGGRFQLASSDDSRVFFLDESRLTSDSTAHSALGQISEPDLYEYDLAKPAGERLSDLSVGQSGPADVTEVLGASEDGSYVYFEAVGTVAGTNATPTTCNMNFNTKHEGQAEEEAATCNVYVHHDGVTSFVAPAGPMIQSAEVSPDGRWLEFMSDKDLTGYDTRDALSGKRDLEVYLYHAPENLAAETGKLVCASCNPTGARPLGTGTEDSPQNRQTYREITLEGIEAAQANGTNSSWMAAGVPTWHELNGEAPVLFHQARYLSDGGRLFFDSGDALVPQDINGKWDVYEYEPAGMRSCTSASATFGAGSGGCVSLISSGTSSADSALLDSSENGDDVFFITTSKLASQDYDTAYDVYDAHVCSGEAPCIAPPAVQPPACDTEASCKASPTPQPEIYGAPSSATFSGTGNVTTPPPPPTKVTKKTVKCKKHFVKNKKGQCVRNKTKKRAKRASRNRRGNS